MDALAPVLRYGSGNGRVCTTRSYALLRVCVFEARWVRRQLRILRHQL